MRLTQCLRMSAFRALVTKAKKTPATIETLQISDLPVKSLVKQSPGICDTIVNVKYSNLNYKDALVALGAYPGLRPPMIPGIDLVGSIEQTSSDTFTVGQDVLINGFGIGTDHFGGFSEKASVCSDWLMPLPSGLTHLDAAKIGTAGYTAMLCVDAIKQGGVLPDDGEILVTGASGGVGSIAVILLNELGYKVTAVTGKSDKNVQEMLKNLGASNIVSRSNFEGDPKPLSKEIYAGAVDTIGGVALTNVLTMIKHSGVVAACGLAGGMELKGATVAPFILRGVTLRGIDSVFQNMETRKKVYENYAPVLINSKKLEIITEGEEQIIPLEKVNEIAEKMLKGLVKGRYVVKI